MSETKLHRKPRWTAEDYAEALLALRAARADTPTGDRPIFRGLTVKNGFDPKRPERITRSKRRTIKKLLSDLEVIRSRRMAFVSPRKPKRRREAQNASGFRSPYMAAIPLPLIPNLRAVVKWSNDKPVVEYPDQKVLSVTRPISKGPIYRKMKAAMVAGDDPGDVIIPEVLRQIKSGTKDIKKLAGPNDLIRYRIRTVYGDLQPGNIYGITDDEADLAEIMGEFMNRYAPTDKEGNFLVGYTAWVVKREIDIPESYKPDWQRVTKGSGRGKKKKAKPRNKRARIKGR